jgi:hypothetical protein
MNGLTGKKHAYYHQQETKVAMHLEALLGILASSMLHRMIVKHHSETFKQIKIMAFLF